MPFYNIVGASQVQFRVETFGTAPREENDEFTAQLMIQNGRGSALLASGLDKSPEIRQIIYY
jgi:hypothetical protein